MSGDIDCDDFISVASDDQYKVSQSNRFGIINFDALCQQAEKHAAEVKEACEKQFKDKLAYNYVNPYYVNLNMSGHTDWSVVKRKDIFEIVSEMKSKLNDDGLLHLEQYLLILSKLPDFRLKNIVRTMALHARKHTDSPFMQQFSTILFRRFQDMNNNKPSYSWNCFIEFLTLCSTFPETACLCFNVLHTICL